MTDIGRSGWRRRDVAAQKARKHERVELQERIIVRDMLLRLRGGEQRLSRCEGRGPRMQQCCSQGWIPFPSLTLGRG